MVLTFKTTRPRPIRASRATAILRYVFVTMASPYFSRYSCLASLKAGSVFAIGLPHQPGDGLVDIAGSGHAGTAAEQVISHGRDLEQDVGAAEHEDGEHPEQISQIEGHRIEGRCHQDGNDHVAKDEAHSGGDDLVKGIADEELKPSPKEEIKLGHNEKGDEDGANEDRDRHRHGTEEVYGDSDEFPNGHDYLNDDILKTCC